MCAQRRLRSAWASTQSDQSLRCPHEESSGPLLLIECTTKTLIRLGGCPGWSQFVGCTDHLVGFVTRRLILFISFRASSLSTIGWSPLNLHRWLGWTMVLDSFQCRGILLLLHIVWQGPAVLAAGAGRVGYIFNLSSISNVLSFGRRLTWLKYCSSAVKPQR